jgi:hypothetical protein
MHDKEHRIALSAANWINVQSCCRVVNVRNCAGFQIDNPKSAIVMLADDNAN